MLKHTALFVMILLTLAAGGGFTISRMICSGSGNTTYELGQMQKCGKQSGDHECVSANCCLMSSSALSADVHTSTAKPDPSNEPMQIVGIPFLTPLEGTEAESNDEEPTNFGPPIIGVTILRLLSTLLI